MEMRENATRPHDMHFVDIHEVPEEEEEEECQENKDTKPTTRGERRFNKVKRPNRNLTRQVSLGTGFSVLNRELKEKKTLPRSGNSFGGFGSTRGRDADETSKVDFSLFRTKSALVQNNNFSGLLNEPENKSVPAGRYFAALTGPELDQVKDHEDILLPTDKKWPFLLRFPIGCFGICLGLSSQSILWLALAISPATKFLNITPFINLGIWLLALSVLIAVSITYTLKCIFYFEAVKREYFHPVRVNFFFAPWVVCMFLAIGTPSLIVPDNHTLHPSVWCAFMIPIAYLDLKIYGQWLSGGKRRLSKVANPSSHLSVVGNFVGAILAAKVGWVEAGKFLWAIGFAHYLVVFVTLYQRLPTSEALPKELHPVYSMFIATPAAASIAWGAIYGEFDGLARTCYFIALFLYCSLIVRINFFTGFRFSVAWWSYTFPMTTASIATIKYAESAPSPISKGFAITLSLMSSTMVCLLMVSTLLHAFVWRTLFPNDLAIAITKTRQLKEKKPLKKGYNLKGWTKQSPLSLVTSIIKHNSLDKDSEKGEVGES